MVNQPLMQWLESLFTSDGKITAGHGKELTPSHPVTKANAHEKEGFEHRLESIISRHPTVTTGRVQLINLEKIRRHLGDKWQKRAKIAHQIICAAIERRLASDDIYSRYSELSYVIVFANLDKKQAQLKSVLIAEEISARMLGKDDHKDCIAVSTLVVKADGNVMFKKLPSISELALALEKAPEQSAVASEGEGNEDGTPHRAEDIQFVFRPIWIAKQRVISTFLCIPVTRTAEGSYLASYSVLSDPNDTTQIFDLDLKTIEKVSEELAKNKIECITALFAIPVHFETLANLNRRSTYFEKCYGALKGAESKIVFEVIGFPEGVPDSRIADILAPLKPLSRSVLARFSIEHENFTGYSTAGVHAVGIDLYASEDDEKDLFRAMDKFVEAANNSSLKTYIHGIRSLSMNTAAVTCGVDYIDGYALTSTSESSEGAYFLKIADLYKHSTSTD